MNERFDLLFERVVVGANLKKFRRKLGLKQADLVTPDFPLSFIRDFEKGRTYHSEEFISYITNRLDITYEDLSKPPAPPRPKYSRRFLNEKLKEAHISQESRRYENALSILHSISLDNLPYDLQGIYLAIAGEAELGLNNLEASQRNFEQSLAIFEHTPSVSSLTREQARYSLGIIFYRRGQYQEALNCHYRCFQAVEDGQIVDPLFKMKAYHAVASNYFFLGELKRAEDCYHKAVEMAATVDEPTLLASIYWGLGVTYNHLKNFAKSKEFYYKSALLFQKLGDLKLAANVKSQAGLGMIEHGEYRQAELAIRSSLELSVEIGDKTAETSALTNLAYLQLLQKQYNEAQKNAERAIVIATTSVQENPVALGQALAQLADIFLEQGQVDKGLTCYRDAETSLRKTDSVQYLSKILLRYTEALEKLGRYAEALEICKLALDCQMKGATMSNQSSRA